MSLAVSEQLGTAFRTIVRVIGGYQKVETKSSVRDFSEKFGINIFIEASKYCKFSSQEYITKI
jgi:hypothetical protein